MYVEDIEDPCILEMDHLASGKGELEFRAMQLTIGRNKVPLRDVDREGLPVMVKSTTVIPPKSSMLLSCQVKCLILARLGVAEQDNRCVIENGVTVGRTPVDPVSGEVPFVVVNFFTRPRKVKEGAIIGLFQEVDQKPRSCACRRSLTKPRGELPDHLQDLFTRSSIYLGGPQLEHLRELLAKNADLPSSGDLGFGYTDLVEHRTDTGNHPGVCCYRASCRLLQQKAHAGGEKLMRDSTRASGGGQKRRLLSSVSLWDYLHHPLRSCSTDVAEV